jgi:thioredoxin-like negative regulator of GroEL
MRHLKRSSSFACWGLLVACAAAAVSAVDLTAENFGELTAGKAVFVKFYAPWCKHCAAIKPAWDKLMHEYREHPDVVIGDCDCTGACKALCQEKGVQGYPTVMFGDPSALEDYKGPRDFDALKRHADTALKPACSPSNLDLCDESQKTLIETLQAMPAADLHAEISKSENEIAAVESQFKADVDKLHAQYKSLEDDKKDAIAQVKSAGLGLMKSIREEQKKTRQASVSEL